jgi:type II secretory pathway component GspD/PulD (secretin)
MNIDSRNVTALCIVALWTALGVLPCHGLVGAAFETRTYPAQPGVFKSLAVTEKGETGSEDAKRYFQDAGVPFPEGSSVTYNNRASLLIVTNTPENLKFFERVLRQLNIEPTQVVIEARFLQMSRDTANDLFKPEVTLGRVSVIKEEVLRRVRELEGQKKITVLAQPRVTTVSGNTAQVKSVEEFRYATEYPYPLPATTNGSAGSATVTYPTPSGFETREIGTLLNVTPTVGPDGQMINLTLVPEISTKIEPPTKIEITTPHGKTMVEQPRFRSRQVTTTVQILSGTTVLLAVADPLIDDEKERDQIVLILLTATVVGIQ